MTRTLQLILVLLLVAVTAAPASAAGESRLAPTAGITEPNVPGGYVLSAAYPNPFNPQTSFTLTVRDRQEVRVEIYNLLGIPVRTLFSGEMESGETRTFTFNAGDLPSGIYLYRVQGENFTATRQMTLLK